MAPPHTASRSRLGTLRNSSIFERRLLPQQNIMDYVDYTIEQMKTRHGNLSIKGLEQKLGITTRQLERLFRARIGLSPKEMGKLIKLNDAFSYLEADCSISLTSLSYEAGYYDQSHFSRDFKSIARVIPPLFSRSISYLFFLYKRQKRISPGGILYYACCKNLRR